MRFIQGCIIAGFGSLQSWASSLGFRVQSVLCFEAGCVGVRVLCGTSFFKWFLPARISPFMV